MKAVMLSIRPEWCQKIISGEKTVELRKSFPAANKVKTPFKCYIYCTKGFPILWKDGEKAFIADSKYEWLHFTPDALNGKVIGEFVCDDVFEIKIFDNKSIRNWNFYNLADACIPYDDLAEYIGANKTGYGWHISELFIYDKPKELSEFFKPRIHGEKDISCFECENSGYSQNMKIECYNRMERAPQSWCYVEELEE